MVTNLLPPVEGKLTLLYEDTDLLVLNKPVGLSVHPTKLEAQHTLANYLVHYCPEIALVGDHPVRPGIVHRLDKNTEGLMVICKTQTAFEAIKSQFQEKSITKKYIALAQGNILSDHMTIQNHMEATKNKDKKMKVVSQATEKSKEAISHLQVIKRFGTQTLIEVTPKTGRTHQIRVHLAYIGHPIIGDTMYNPAYARKPQAIQKLQAIELGFTHPTKAKRLHFKIPISERL
jgi:23S rRNA pseudouridine1911/1915/1917 synthase